MLRGKPRFWQGMGPVSKATEIASVEIGACLDDVRPIAQLEAGHVAKNSNRKEGWDESRRRFDRLAADSAISQGLRAISVVFADENIPGGDEKYLMRV